jgi:hypothetical protein
LQEELSLRHTGQAVFCCCGRRNGEWLAGWGYKMYHTLLEEISESIKAEHYHSLS